VAKCGGEDEQSAAGADIQFDGVAGWEEGVPVEFLGEVVEGLEPGLEWPSGGRRGHAEAFAGVVGVGSVRCWIVGYCGGNGGEASGSEGLQAAEGAIVLFLGICVTEGGITGRLDGGKKRDLALWEGSAC